MGSEFLAEYRTERLYVTLSSQEQEQYQKAREQYRQFVADLKLVYRRLHSTEEHSSRRSLPL
jgi:hypothetical protein